MKRTLPTKTERYLLDETGVEWSAYPKTERYRYTSKQNDTILVVKAMFYWDDDAQFRETFMKELYLE